MITQIQLNIGKTIEIESERQTGIKKGDTVKIEVSKDDPNFEFFNDLELQVIGVWEEISGINEIKLNYDLSNRGLPKRSKDS